MATAFTQLGTQSFTTATGTHTVTATPAANDLIVLVLAHSGYTGTDAPTDNNSDGLGTYTLAKSALSRSSGDTLAVWVRDHLVGSATSTVFTAAPGTTSGGGLAVMKLTGMTRVSSNAVKKTGSQDNGTGGTTPAASWTGGGSAATTNSVLAALMNQTSPGGVAKPTTFTTRQVNDGYAMPTTGIDIATVDSGNTDSTVTWGGNSTLFGHVIVEFDATAFADSGTASTTLSGSRSAEAIADVGTGSQALSGSKTFEAYTDAGTGTASLSGSGSGSISGGDPTDSGTAGMILAAVGTEAIADQGTAPFTLSASGVDTVPDDSGVVGMELAGTGREAIADAGTADTELTASGVESGPSSDVLDAGTASFELSGTGDSPNLPDAIVQTGGGTTGAYRKPFINIPPAKDVDLSPIVDAGRAWMTLRGTGTLDFADAGYINFRVNASGVSSLELGPNTAEEGANRAAFAAFGIGELVVIDDIDALIALSAGVP